MKYVTKQNEPPSLSLWKNKNVGAQWPDFSGTAAYQELRTLLIDQQEEMCCYCEQAIKPNDAHVEHLKDQHRHPQLMFDYFNLLASCNYNDSCGHKKGSQYFPEMVSPLKPQCEARFTYTDNGKMIPSDENDEDALETIKILGLNSKRLKDRRQSIIRNLGQIEDEHYLHETLRNCLSWHDGFFTVVKYVASRLI